MSLTIGDAPFGSRPGAFNFTREGPDRALYLENSPRFIRGDFAGTTVVSSKHAKLLHETGLLPVYYFPLDDVRIDLLVETDHHTHCPLKGDASYWSVKVGDAVSENAVWTYPDPIDGAPPIKGLVAFYWHKLDHWFEEDEEVFVHARDPYHRVDILPSSRHVKVSLDGRLLAETRTPLVAFETGLPPRYYIRRSDVRLDLLKASGTQTECPYKGAATYQSAEGSDDLVWCYEDPIPAARDIAGYLAFFNERVDLEVDGELLERPRTRWSPRS
jgi:uncharacterized protein (DUF427 family)